jgi:predicted ArsR family transcriptional regulator
MNEDILAVLDDHEQLSVVEIADAMGAHPVTVDRHCYRLQQDGYLRVYSSGIYQLAADGANQLAQGRSE